MATPMFYNILDDLLRRVNQAGDPEFLQSYLALPFDQLSTRLKNETNEDLQQFVAVIILQKLGNEAENIENIDLFTLVHNVIVKDERLKAECYEPLDTFLTKYTFETQSVEDLYKLGLIAAKIKELKPELEEAYMCVENQAASLYYDSLIDVMENRNEETALIGAKYLEKFSKLGFDVELTAEIFSNGVIEFILDRNGFRENEKKIVNNVQKDYEILNYLLDTKMSEVDHNAVTDCKNKLGEIGPEESKNKDKYERIRPKLFKAFEIGNKDAKIDKSLVKIENQIKQLKFPDFTVNFSKVLYNNKRAIMKEYILNIQDPSRKREIEDKIAIEAKCMKYLSETEANRSFFKYLNFFYENVDSNYTCLIQPYQSQKTLSEYRRVLSANMPSLTIKKIVYHIIKAFNELENNNIYHQNISFDSIMIDELQITVVDFYYAVHQKENYCLENDQNQARNQYYWPSKREESKGEPGKMDVFALGLVILQFFDINFTDVSNEKEVYDALDKIEAEWLKSLLQDMLEKDIKKRFSFKNLGPWMEEISVTLSSSVSKIRNT